MSRVETEDAGTRSRLDSRGWTALCVGCTVASASVAGVLQVTGGGSDQAGTGLGVGGEVFGSGVRGLGVAVRGWREAGAESSCRYGWVVPDRHGLRVLGSILAFEKAERCALLPAFLLALQTPKKIQP